MLGQYNAMQCMTFFTSPFFRATCGCMPITRSDFGDGVVVGDGSISDAADAADFATGTIKQRQLLIMLLRNEIRFNLVLLGSASSHPLYFLHRFFPVALQNLWTEVLKRSKLTRAIPFARFVVRVRVVVLLASHLLHSSR